MAFHIACPFTCRRICDCELGFPAGLRGEAAKKEFLEGVAALDEFFKDPWTVRPAAAAAAAEATVQVLVPRLVAPPPPPPPAVMASAGLDDGVAAEEARRAVMQRQAQAASVAAEDYARRLEAGSGADVPGEATSNFGGEDQGLSTVRIICRLCTSGETEGSEKANKMLSCKTCNKKYHKSCLKGWAENRDLFHWSSWSCPSCRICEVCRRTGDPNKFMYCKRCDGAYHCYCQQPPHKNVGHGPYLCPKHTRCHSCGSTVPGSGLSTRWFLGYTCCDACGRLFQKGNYCPVCLKVYRDSEITPMVCCDICERWVHCVCDGISDEKYQQFQVDSNLQYKCAACRGDCYQIKDVDDAVRELWKRKDIADCDLIASLRAAAGLPSQEDPSSDLPYSDEEQSGPVVLKNENKPLTFSVKGVGDKSWKNSKKYGKNVGSKKVSKKKEYPIKPEEAYEDYEKQHETRSMESILRDRKRDEINSDRVDGPEPHQSLTNNGVKSGIDQAADFDLSSIREATGNNVGLVPKVRIKSKKWLGLQPKDIPSENEAVKSTKLVIHLGSRNRNVSGSPRSETSSCQRDQDLTTSLGSEANIQHKGKEIENNMLGPVRTDEDLGGKINNTEQTKGPRAESRNIVKIGKTSDGQKKVDGSFHEEHELNATYCHAPEVTNRDHDVNRTAETEPPRGKETLLSKKQTMSSPVNYIGDSRDKSKLKFSSSTSSDAKPLLKLKFKNPYFEQKSSWMAQGEEDTFVKGQRSKRKRPSVEKKFGWEDAGSTQPHQENIMDATIDANWILQKLGKDAIGKKIEVQLSDGSWAPGVVSDMKQGGSSLSVRLDDGRFQSLELGKQAVRFVSQKRKGANA